MTVSQRVQLQPHFWYEWMCRGDSVLGMRSSPAYHPLLTTLPHRAPLPRSAAAGCRAVLELRRAVMELHLAGKHSKPELPLRHTDLSPLQLSCPLGSIYPPQDKSLYKPRDIRTGVDKGDCKIWSNFYLIFCTVQRGTQQAQSIIGQLRNVLGFIKMPKQKKAKGCLHLSSEERFDYNY